MAGLHVGLEVLPQPIEFPALYAASQGVQGISDMLARLRPFLQALGSYFEGAEGVEGCQESPASRLISSAILCAISSEKHCATMSPPLSSTNCASARTGTWI